MIVRDVKEKVKEDKFLPTGKIIPQVLQSRKEEVEKAGANNPNVGHLRRQGNREKRRYRPDPPGDHNFNFAVRFPAIFFREAVVAVDEGVTRRHLIFCTDV